METTTFHEFTTTDDECEWCGAWQCDRHCHDCGEFELIRDGRHKSAEWAAMATVPGLR